MYQRSINRSSQLELSKVSAPVQQKVAMKMVRSSFEPPEQTQPSYHYPSQFRTDSNFQDAIPYLDQGSDQFFNPSINYNLQFLKTLMPLENSIQFDEGDRIPIQSDDRWIIASGEVKVSGVNGLQFLRKAGFIFFASIQSKRRVKQVVATQYTTAYKIPQQIFKQQVRNFLYMKNAEKIKFMKYCPFLIWNQSLAEDIAIGIDLIDNLEKDTEIYKSESEAEYLYFVKEGIVLLERLGKAGNQVIQDYQKHYESTYLSEEEGILIVRKGMIFGVDGILIKQKATQINLLQNPQNLNDDDKFHQYQQQSKEIKLKQSRIYTAKAIGKVQIFRLHKNILQTYLKMSEYLKSHPQENSLSNKELDRICMEYTNLLMGSNKLSKSLKKKNFDFDVKISAELQDQMQKKRKKVEEIKYNQRKMRKMSHKQLPPRESENLRYTEENQIDLFAAKSPKKLSANRQSSKNMKEISLPSLNRRHMEHLIMKQLEAKESKQAKKYLNYKKKIDNNLLSKQLKPSSPSKKLQSLQCIKVKSYRSLLSSLS